MLNKYILNKTKDYQVITILARISEHQNNYKNAIKLYKKVLNSKSSLERQTAWIAIAVLLKNNNENSKSKKMFLNYLKTFPNGVFRKDVHKELRSR